MPALTAIALSGGIDSLAAGFLLKADGHRLIGLHFSSGYERASPDDNSEKAIRRVADQLGIALHVIDLRDAFQREVVAYFVDEYRRGRTPNPCVVCNARIKLGALLEQARRLGADRLATGHYARLRHADDGRVHLWAGIDRHKDQSYFLALIPREHLGRALFPLGTWTKTRVAALAAEQGLRPLRDGESQDICFIAGQRYGDFLAAQGQLGRPGLIEDVQGNILGEHPGLHLFTVGQRRGINCPGRSPYYVVRLDRPRNRLVVGAPQDLLTTGCRVVGINWIQPLPHRLRHVAIKIRYRTQAHAARLDMLGNDAANVRFDHPQPAVTPGQAAVFYAADEVLGGGWIENSL